MKAILIDQPGSSEQLKLSEIPTPQPQKNEVLVKIHAAAINHVDIWVRQGLPAYPVKFPHVLGADGAGVVESVGPEAEGVAEGDRVLIVPGIACGQCDNCRKGLDNQCDTFEIVGAKRHGTYAEYVAVPDQNVVVIPDQLSFETAAAFPLAYLTAWHMLIGRAKLAARETLLVLGAGAGVGVAAVQIAKWKGARIFAVTTSGEKLTRIKSLGADDVFLQDESSDFSVWVRERTGKRGVDVVFEHVGPATWERSIHSLAKNGRLVTCGATTGPKVETDLRFVFSKDLSILGAKMGTQKEFQDLTELVFSGKLKPVVDKVFPLKDAVAAHAYVENKKQVGKVLLKP